jgi:hypothetical protein
MQRIGLAGLGVSLVLAAHYQLLAQTSSPRFEYRVVFAAASPWRVSSTPPDATATDASRSPALSQG